MDHGTDGVFGAERRGLTVGVLLIITLVAFEALATATVMPAAEEDLGGLRLYAWAFSGFLLASIPGIMVAGRESDRVGPARPFIIGLMLFATGLVIAGLAPAMWALVGGRVVQGLGAGFIPTVIYVVAARAYPEELRPRLFALFSTAWVVPGLVGPGVAGALAEYASWRLAFLALLPLVGVAAWLTIPALRSLDRVAAGGATGGSLAPALQVTAGAALLLAGLTTGTWLLGLPLVAAGLAIGLRVLPGLLPRGVFRLARGLPATVAGMALLNFIFLATDSWAPYTLTSVRGQSSLVAGLVITTATLSWTAGSWIVERGARRYPRRLFVALGFACVAGGSGSLALVPWDWAPVMLAVPAWMLAGLGMGLAYPNFGLITLAEAPPGQEGEASSALKLSEAIGNALGAGCAGAIVAAGEARGLEVEALTLNFGLMGALAVAGMLVCVRLPGTVAEQGAGRAEARVVLAPPAAES